MLGVAAVSEESPTASTRSPSQGPHCAKASTSCRRRSWKGAELDLRLLVDHRERLVRQRVALNNTLQWHLHDLWPDQTLPGSALFSTKWSTRIGRRLARAEQSTRVRIARDELRRLRELTQTIKSLEPRSPPSSRASRHSCFQSPGSGR
jgi:transposase